MKGDWSKAVPLRCDTSIPSSVIAVGLVWIGLAWTVLGCADEPLSPEREREQIAFTVSGSPFTPGDTIIATLVNRSDQTLGYNLCLAVLDRRADSDWQRIQRHSGDTFCPLMFVPLGPGESGSLAQPVREDFPAGLYRLQTEIRWPLEVDARFLVTTGTFRIEQ
jgi:hypothetical protein